MRRLMVITALALFFAVPLCAQRGGRAGGGFHGGFTGGHAGVARGGFGAGHVSSGMRGGPARGFHSPGTSRGFNHRGFSGSPFLHNGFRNRHRFFANGFRNNCFGWRCRGFSRFGSPWWGWGYYDPWLWSWWNDDNRFDEEYDRNLALANEMDRQSIERQRMWQQDEAQRSDRDEDTYTPRARSNASDSADQASSATATPTVLVYRDQHQKEIRNYAIVGQTLWNFASPRTEKIPLSDLDLGATVKANEDRGVTFTIPGSTEGQ